MPRGGNNGGYKNSPTIGLQGELYENEGEKRAYISKTMSELMYYYGRNTIKCEQEGRERLQEYFDRCVTIGSRPTVEEMCMALGTTRQSLWEWETGKKHGPLDADSIKKAKELIASFDAKAVSEGKLNPVAYIFRSKNFYGMKDQQDVVVSPKQETDVTALLEQAESLPDDDEKA